MTLPKLTRQFLKGVTSSLLLLIICFIAGPSFISSSSSSSSLVHLFKPVPGLYPPTELIHPIQGHSDFEKFISPGYEYLDSNNNFTTLIEQRLSIVQFYMASCPHCQGFAPYFRRFVNDIGPHWHKFIQVFVVNCDDDANVDVCWAQSKSPFVPSVRWVSSPSLLSVHDTKKLDLLKEENLSWEHRDVIEKQRRDLISLRHTTLDFALQQVKNLRRKRRDVDPNQLAIPLQWKLFEPLLVDQQVNLSSFIQSDNLLEVLDVPIAYRSKECLSLWNGKIKNLQLDNYVIIYENNNNNTDNLTLYSPRTVVADWSNHTCTPMSSTSAPERLMMVHYARKSSPAHIKHKGNSSPYHIMHMRYQLDPKTLDPVLIEEKRLDIPMELAESDDQRLAQSSQKIDEKPTVNLDQANSGSTPHETDKNINNQLARKLITRTGGSRRRKRDATPATPATAASPVSPVSPATKIDEALLSPADVIKILNETDSNWIPPEPLYSGEELTRRNLNKLIREKVIEIHGLQIGDLIPLVGQIKNPGEIKRVKTILDPNSIIPAKEDDSSPLKLTDYYKVLAQIVHKNIIQRKEVDGYQLLASTCFLEQLINAFPFQGVRTAEQSSISKSYLKKLHIEHFKLLREELVKTGSNISTQLNASMCSSWNHFEFDESTHRALQSLKIPSRTLQLKQQEIRSLHNLDIPDDAHFSWTYCKGSKDYLRGHTCALWVLFHTLTVRDYLETTNRLTIELPFVKNQSTIYEYTVNYEKNNQNANCDPTDPEPAYMNATSIELFVNEPKSTLGNIINFVRFYLGCTNCASHFNCMVKHSDIDYEHPEPGAHLLWVWEAHNRVNLRTKNTHSEDPTRPKHIFPNYEVCPECYVSKPTDLITGGGYGLDDVKFYRQPLIDFLVGRYRRSALINNKMRIEDLYKKPIPIKT